VRSIPSHWTKNVFWTYFGQDSFENPIETKGPNRSVSIAAVGGAFWTAV
jgi:hypothetical protein